MSPEKTTQGETGVTAAGPRTNEEQRTVNNEGAHDRQARMGMTSRGLKTERLKANRGKEDEK